ncbi:MAG: hypothetical protein OHK93_003074 [Ramalina farinacea]|uniref:Transmembrane protein 69 n=1 Tax=Ramalina farinacea TaxID=258253 RepID=A0AA43QSK6_9LECA|nr:hypothetical protein [Ramalina farinacea]
MMIRSKHAAALARSNLRCLATPPTRTATSLAWANGSRANGLGVPTAKRYYDLALAVRRPLSTSVQRYQSGGASPYDHIDKKHELALEREKLEAHPDEVSEASSVHGVFSEKGVEEPEKNEDMLAGVKEDLKTIKDTFALDEVPREALNLGMAGVLPYLATSLSTVYLAWDINHASITGQGFLLSGQTAEVLLQIIEPIQIGYGAVIISFLGAIHWGLEWAKYGGTVGYTRYAYGVVAPAIAWPTMLLPIEYALISQFCAFTFLYFADARAVVRGWAPAWYSTYRFVLTFVVGASIVVSLIGRGQIADKINRLPSPADRVKALRDMQISEMEEEERYRRDKIVAEDEEGDDEEEGEDEEEE